MSYRSAGTVVIAAGTTGPFTIQSGVVSTDTLLVVISSSTNDGTGFTGNTNALTCSNGGATVTQFLAGRQSNNLYWKAWKVTGAVAGDTLSVTAGGNKEIQAWRFDGDLAVGTVADRGGVSQATVTAPTYTIPTSGHPFVFYIERTTANLAGPSYSNANAFTVTSDYYLDQTSDPAVSYNVAHLSGPSPGAATGITTATYPGASGNAAGFHFAEILGTVVTTSAVAWNVAATITPKTSAANWAVRASITPKTSAASWNVAAAIAKTSAAAWAVRQAVTATDAVVWAVRQGLTKTQSIEWDVASQTSVDTSQAVAWGVRAALAKTQGTAWSVRQTAATTTPVGWSVRQPATKTGAATWIVRQQVDTSLNTVWHVAGLAGATFSIGWDVHHGIPRDPRGLGAKLRPSIYSAKLRPSIYSAKIGDTMIEESVVWLHMDVFNADADAGDTCEISLDGKLTWTPLEHVDGTDWRVHLGMGEALDPREDATALVAIATSDGEVREIVNAGRFYVTTA